MEKLLKGLVIKKTGEVAPHIHDLEALLQKINITVEKEQIKKLSAFTDFNMKCRYPNVKFAFYKLCTREFTEQYFKEAKKLILWLKGFYQNSK